MNYWLLLADPKAYSFDQLQADGRTVWDGISGSLAQKRLRTFKKEDRALIYHTAPDKAVIGTAQVLSDPRPDPKDETGRLVVVDVEATSRLKNPVSLDALKKNNKLANMSFLKIQRIAVAPLEKAEFDEILRMGA
ncbi:MAG TPA: EVE domain-containing protein [Acidobacteriota bacterium]|nr:EVE domain-containing protein [Acidobacteriota bacterium]